MSKNIHDFDRPSWGVSLARALSLVASIAAGVAVFWGLRGVLAAEGGLASWLIPAAAATALTCLLAGGWHMLMGMAAHVDRRRVVLVLGLGAGLTAAAIATSSWWLATAIGGGTALRYHNERMFARIEGAAKSILDQAEPERLIIDAIHRARSVYRSLVHGEIREGRVSGKVGRGPVAKELEDAEREFSDMEATILDVINQRQVAVNSARSALQEAERASEAGRAAAVSEAINTAFENLADAARFDASSLAISGSVIRSGSSGLSGLDEAMANVADVARRVKQNRRSVELPTWTSMSRSEAVMTYSDRVGMAWIVAVALDSLPLLLLGALIVARGETPGGGEGSQRQGWSSPDVHTLRRNEIVATGE